MRSRHGIALGFFAAILVTWAGIMVWVMRDAALPPQANGTMIAVFEPGISRDEAFARLALAGARPVRESSLAFIWVVNDPEPGLAGRLHQQGAAAYRELPFSPTLAGCVAVAEQKIAAYTGL